MVVVLHLVMVKLLANTKHKSSRSGGGVRLGCGHHCSCRLPKRGFTNINVLKNMLIVNLDQLNAFWRCSAEAPYSSSRNRIAKNHQKFGNGELTKKLTVKAAKFPSNQLKKYHLKVVQLKPKWGDLCFWIIKKMHLGWNKYGWRFYLRSSLFSALDHDYSAWCKCKNSEQPSRCVLSNMLSSVSGMPRGTSRFRIRG